MGGIMAAAWAMLKCMGQDGYLEMAKKLMTVSNYLKKEIHSIEGLHLVGHPHGAAFAIASTDPQVNVQAIAKLMDKRGWKLQPAQNCIHLTILPSHTIEVANQLITDLRSCTSQLKMNPSLPGGSTSLLMGQLPDSALQELVVQFFNEMHAL
ncbi:sphingosine-1-phosphate lyase-like isoform X2 [Dysidea avara]|uniref:sphingosine-1-phosphate lyase-like isoform X2 n=1 Tax=Dysidea avara TaxID=196820 RepID=UPI00332B4A64